MFGIELTAGMVSSIIAAGVATFQFTFPIFLGLVVAGSIQNSSTAATWSVITTLLQNSNLHTILQSDSANLHNVARPIQMASWLAFFSLVLAYVCSVVMPLGISETIMGTDVTGVGFEWARDNDSFTLGTADRNLYGLSRVCGTGEEKCPGQETETVDEEEGSFEVAPWAPETVSSSWVDTVTSTGSTWSTSMASSSTSSIVITFSSEKSSSTGTGTGTGTGTASVTGTGSESSSSTTPTNTRQTGRTTSTETPIGTQTSSSSSSSGAGNSNTRSTTTPTNTPSPTSDGINIIPSNILPTSRSSSAAADPPASSTNNVNTPPARAETSSTPTATQQILTKDSVPATSNSPASADPVVQLPGSATSAPPSVGARSNDDSDLVAASLEYMALHKRSIPTPEAKPIKSKKSLRRRATAKKYRIGSSVPESLSKFFTRASFYGATVANLLDIQFRNYIILNAPQHTLTGGLKYTIGQFRFLETLILSNGFKLVDGLIVNAAEGGIGFRKHASPDKERTKYGASWSETLLWMEPETVCVANNISIQVTTTDDGGSEAVLYDAGGFKVLTGDGPVLGADGGIPKLGDRAWNGAWYFNKEIAAAVNAEGKGGNSFELESGTSSSWLEQLSDISGELGNRQFMIHRMALGAKVADDGTQNATGIDINCSGLTVDTPSGAPFVSCGLIVGSPRRTDASSSTLAGTYRYPLFTCASAIRASLKTTAFVANGTTSDLTTLTLHNTTLITTPPLWGVEKNSNLKSWQINPLWGLINPEDKGAPELVTKTSQYLYLPAGQLNAGIEDSLAGTGAYMFAANLMWETSEATPDYSGRTNYALYRRWEKVTANATSVAVLPGLIWSDVMANLVTSVTGGGQGVKTVHVYSRAVAYNYVYATPGFLLGMLWMGMFAVAIAFWVGRRVRFGQLKQLLNQVSTGRLVVNMLVDGSKESSLGTDRWARRVGNKLVGLECRKEENYEGWEREGDDLVSGMVVGFVEEPVEGRVLELLRKQPK